jgi:GntR family transcriptional regulator, transcriptional repressor for pyruvate dehydrogenase complex
MGGVDQCAAEIRQSILRGVISVGARLPAERALAEQFGVNRVTVRGALARLESEGLVDVRQGSGYTVRRWTRTAGPELVGTIVGLARDGKERRAIVGDLLLVRRKLAASVLEQLAERGSKLEEARIAAIETAVERLAAEAKRRATLPEIARADLEVAATVVEATGSVVLSLCMNPVAELLVGMPALQAAMFRAPENNVAAWRVLVAWLRSGCSRAGMTRIVDALEERDAKTMKEIAR